MYDWAIVYFGQFLHNITAAAQEPILRSRVTTQRVAWRRILKAKIFFYIEKTL
jgi:hypothetical protein